MKYVYVFALIALALSTSNAYSWQTITEEKTIQASDGSNEHIYHEYMIDEYDTIVAALSMNENDKLVRLSMDNLYALNAPYGKEAMVVIHDNGRDIEIRDGMMILAKIVLLSPVIPKYVGAYKVNGIGQTKLRFLKYEPAAVRDTDWEENNLHRRKLH